MIFNVTTELLTHQKHAICKIVRSRVGALFMEMGTGKSLTAIALAHFRQKRLRNVVWFAPVSLKETVRHEILKHTDTPADQVVVFDHKTNIRTIPRDRAWYVVGTESMSRSARLKLTANSIIWSNSMVIVDESTYIKGHRSARTCWITDISQKARYRLILTGTPLTQGVVDLFAQMRFLSPKILGYASFYSFARNHLEYSDRFPGMIVAAHNVEWLAAKVQPYVYQVTKEECLDLPPKIYESCYFSMTWEQRVLYEQTKHEILLDIDYDRFESYTLFRLFTALQKIVSGYYTDEDGSIIALAHERTNMLLYAVEKIPENEKVIVWAKYIYDIKAIRASIDARFGDGSSVLFFGGLKEKDRSDAVENWKRQDGPRFFVATPSCAGHGLTLNEACHAIFYNNGFKYSERVQAEDRCHRLGQDRKVLYVDLCCSDSIDERIANSLARKENVVSSFKEQVDDVKDKGKLRKLIESL